MLFNTKRAYMQLDDPAPKSLQSGWEQIGSTGIPSADLPGPRLSSQFVISGDHILNVVFDRHLQFEPTKTGYVELEAAYQAKLRQKQDTLGAPPAGE